MSAMPEIDSSLSDTSLNNQVLLRRTSHGVVHVTASGYKGIGYGVGYAYTQDNRCLLAHRIAEVNGRLSEQLGAEAPVTSEVHDITYTGVATARCNLTINYPILTDFIPKLFPSIRAF